MSAAILIFSVVLPSSLLGGVLAYRLGFRNLEALAPVGAGLALVAYLLSLNLLAYLVPIKTSFWLTGLLLLLLAGGLLIRPVLAAENTNLSLDRRAAGVIAVVTFVCGLFFGIVIFSTPGFDAGFHWPLISTISHGNFPVRLPQSPDFYVQYHYGFDLVAAAVGRLADLSPWTASALTTSVVVALAALLASALGHHAWGSLRLALLMPLFLFFSGGLLYLDVFRDLASSEDLWGYGQQIVDRIFSQQPFGRGYFHGSMVDTYAVVLHARTQAFGMPLFLLFLFLAYRQSREPHLGTALFLGATLGALALAQVTTFAIAAASFALYRGGLLILRWRREGVKTVRRQALLDSLILAVAGLLAVVQGGVITDALLHSGGGDVSGSITSLSLRREIGFVSAGGFVPIGGGGWWQTVLKEFGLPLLLFPAYVVVAVRRPHPVTSLLVIVSTLSFLTPLFMEYPTSDGELRRLFGLSQVSNGLLLAITLNHLLSWAGSRPFALVGACALVALVAFSPLMFNLRAFPSSPRAYDPSFPPAEYAVAEAARDLVPERARVLTAWPNVVMILWGRFVPYAESRDALFTPTEAWKRAMQHPDRASLHRMNIDYVYWNPTWQAELSDGKSDLEGLPYLTRVYEYTNGLGQEYVIYQVEDLAPDSFSGLWYLEHHLRY